MGIRAAIFRSGSDAAVPWRPLACLRSDLRKESAYGGTMRDFDPYALAARQIEMDRQATERMPFLFDRKRLRLESSPHGFLRGSARLFYEILAANADLATGDSPLGFIVGDMHLENVGAYRDERGETVFGLNDFDDGTVAPVHLDLLRLSTSVILAGRGYGATGPHAIELVHKLIEGYLAGLTKRHTLPEPHQVTHLVERSKRRTAKELLDDRVPVDQGRRRFLRGPRYVSLLPDVASKVPALLAAYVASLGKASTGMTIEDSAQRIAGNGSLGVIRIALLVRESDGGEHLMELKECGSSATEALRAPIPGHFTYPAERCVVTAKALLVAPPRKLAPVKLGDQSFIGRRLFPAEDKLDLEGAHLGNKFEDLVSYIGHLLGAAHARGIASIGGMPSATFNGATVEGIVDHAMELAGMMESVYLAYSRLMAKADGGKG